MGTLDVVAMALAVAADSSYKTSDGTDLLLHQSGESKVPPHESMFWAIGGQAAVRKGKWKWLTTQTSGNFLFDVELVDPELHNLAQVQPEVEDELDSELQA